MATGLERMFTVTRVIKFLMLDLGVGLFFCWLIIDNPRRWPALVVLIPVMLVVNLALVRRMLGNRNAASMSLPAVYFCGLVYGVWWTINDFVWWRVVLLLIPFALLIIKVQRYRKASLKKANI